MTVKKQGGKYGRKGKIKYLNVNRFSFARALKN